MESPRPQPFRCHSRTVTVMSYDRASSYISTALFLQVKPQANSFPGGGGGGGGGCVVGGLVNEMAGNDWINSYLEAILDVGPGLDEKKSSLLLRERGRFSPTRYFVEEVVSGFDETDLHRSWVRVCSY
ncbi:unnamed protein product [Dovyalis caffra]|uniref:Uncharacterized protein n=1 Tax=Dovyalis caffra TaxID=77055 RepID=A0AAV1S5U8_9ROSI|nr:unnamed protein product [Dovyalis caffra]